MEAGTDRCKRIVGAIQQLSTLQQEELFKILHRNKCEYTQNNNGVFISMNWMPEVVLSTVERYIEFCTKSHTQLTRYESICDVLNRKLHEERSAREGALLPAAEDVASDGQAAWGASSSQAQAQAPDPKPEDASAEDENEEAMLRKGKLSSSMRFYLLKKRFAKTTPPTVCGDDALTKDAY